MTTPAIARLKPHDIGDPHTLADEHARLLRDVIRRTAPVLALLDARAWPYAELGTLTTFLRASMLPRISDEEVHLFPPDSTAPPFTGLGADHARLHSLTAELEKVHAVSCPRAHLHALVDQLLATLRRHLKDEEEVLAATPAAAADRPANE